MANNVRVESPLLRNETSNKCVSFFTKNSLLLCTVLGAGIGFGVGFGIRSGIPSADTIMWIGLPGEMFIRMLMMTILPLIVASIIAGTASLNPRSNGRISTIALTYIIVTNGIGALLGLALAYAIKTGRRDSDSHTSTVETEKPLLQTQDIFADMIRNLFPDNMVTACFQKAQTAYTKTEGSGQLNGTNVTVIEYTRRVGAAPGVNILGLIIVSTLLGMATGKVGDIGKPFLAFFQAASEIIIRVLRWLIWFTPFGVCSLIAKAVSEVKELEDTFRSLGMLALAMVICILIHQLILLPLAYFVFIRKNPFKFMYSAARAWMAGFAPPSTAVAIPEMLNTCENNNNVDKRVSRFVIPFAAALNRIGSCAFMVIASIFMARFSGVEPSAGQVVLIVVLCWVGSLAIPAVPSSSIITIIIVLNSVDITTDNIGLLMALDWLLDRIRTTSNVMSVTFCAIFTHHFCKDALAKQDHARALHLKNIDSHGSAWAESPVYRRAPTINTDINLDYRT